MSKPILWVSVTSHAEEDKESALAEVEDRVKQAVGDDYNVVVATDKVRLATKEDIERLGDELSRLTEREYEQMDESAEARRDRKAQQLDLPTGQEPEQDPDSGGEDTQSGEMDLSAAMGGETEAEDTEARPSAEAEQVAEDLEWDEEDEDQGELDGMDADDVL
jgi:hypothetical protein